MAITIRNDADVNNSTFTYLQNFVESYSAAVNSGSIVNEVSRKMVVVTLTDMPEVDGAGRPLQVNGMTSSDGKWIKIDIDLGKNRSDGELAATLLHELTHAHNPSLISAKGLTNPNSVHAPAFYEKVQGDGSILHIPVFQSGTNSNLYEQALSETGQSGVAVVQGASSSLSNEIKSIALSTPADTAIQKARDMLKPGGAYADAIIRQVAAAKTKREQEIAAQQESNRDRQGIDMPSSTPAPASPGKVANPTATPNSARVPGVSYGGQDADGRREGGSQGTTAAPSQAARNGHHIVIDLDGDGVEISPLGGSAARFDYDGDGFQELTAWVGKDDGLLIYDIGNDGVISQTKEVVIADSTAEMMIEYAMAA